MAKDFFDKVGDTVTKAADAAVTKTEDFFTVTKIKGKIAEEERMIKQICCNIGRQVFEEYTNGIAYSEEIVKMCEDIGRHEEEKKVQQRDLDLFRSKRF